MSSLRYSGSHRAARNVARASSHRGHRRSTRAPTVATRLRGPAADDEEDFFGTGLTLHKVDRQKIRWWAGFQVVALLFQFSLWREVRGHLNLYEDTLALQCSPERSRHGVCIGPMWNVSAWKEFVLHGTAYLSPRPLTKRSQQHRAHTGTKMDSISVIDTEIQELEEETAERLKELKARRQELQIAQGLLTASVSNASVRTSTLDNSTYIFEFETRSSPPTFLMSVDPVTRSQKSGEAPPPAPVHFDSHMETEGSKQYRHWTLQVRRIDPIQTKADFHKSGSGSDVMTIEDLSPESQATLDSAGSIRWQATIMNSDRSSRQTRFVAVVEDFRAPHLEQVHASVQCSFVSAWKAFNQNHQGQSHQALSLCSALLGIFLPVGAAAAYVVYTYVLREPLKPEKNSKQEDLVELGGTQEETEWQQAARHDEECCDCNGYGFHAVVLGKLFTMDVPQQVCIVLYLLGWYETKGLRCQLCLFHPEHCEEEHPFKLANSAAFLCTLLSSVANQLIIRPAMKHTISEEDICIRNTARISLACVSVLPFTTGVYSATSALLTTPVVAQVLVFFPCAIGWLAVVGSAFCCLIACCND
eukprot:TRINITY_DN33971_c0_g1_i1.p1 TRINITY_DN33971_c0_g1~~TRINITY_DN33971_c0_g1_i1.p1  ORF type:complete len:587 (-),score=102.59 TRINITY_DN33971_c0_g1_i1:59-1819(-)